MTSARLSESLARFSLAAARRDALLKRMWATGKTPKGSYLWTASELTLVRLPLSHKALNVLLPNRTVKAIEQKRAGLGLSRSHRVWFEPSLAYLKRHYPHGLPIGEMVAGLGSKSKKQIYRRASYDRLRRPRKAPLERGLPLFDAVRHRAFQLNLSCEDLDLMARTGRYFRSAPKVDDVANAGRAICALGETPTVVWTHKPSHAHFFCGDDPVMTRAPLAKPAKY